MIYKRSMTPCIEKNPLQTKNNPLQIIFTVYLLDYKSIFLKKNINLNG